MPCPLCHPIPGLKKLRYEDDTVWVAEIEGVGCPVIALKKHKGIATDTELGYVRMVLEQLNLWDPSRYSEGTNNPGHYHVYIRSKPPKTPVIKKMRHLKEEIPVES